MHEAMKMNRNIVLALALGAVALGVGVSVFAWRLTHRLPPMPEGSVYGSAYLPSVPAAPQSPQEQPYQRPQTLE
jgi:hypothetical protein